jgi:hypothetical protein
MISIIRNQKSGENELCILGEEATQVSGPEYPILTEYRYITNKQNFYYINISTLGSVVLILA